MNLRCSGSYDVDLASEESGLSCPEKSLAVQSSKDECDINVLVKRFGITGQLPQALAVPTFVDFQGVFDFQSAMNLVLAARSAFMAVPADVRARFGNDPQEFVAFVSDPGNLDEVRKLGLAPGAKVEPPVDVPAKA